MIKRFSAKAKEKVKKMLRKFRYFVFSIKNNFSTAAFVYLGGGKYHLRKAPTNSLRKVKAITNYIHIYVYSKSEQKNKKIRQVFYLALRV